MAYELLPPGGDTSWFAPVREGLASEWRATRPEPDTPLVCGLQTLDQERDGHRSLPCALADDDQAILDLLESPSSDNDPVRFTRVFLMVLDDFIESLEDARRLLGDPRPPKPPASVSVWTNYFAKHRQNLLVMHHPACLMLDYPDAERWEQATRAAGDVTVIDQQWLGLRGRRLPDPSAVRANDDPAVVVLPRLDELLQSALTYYRDFGQWAAQRPTELAKFNTPDHELWFKTLLDRVIIHVAPERPTGSTVVK
ncbi:MAG: hypothetical protein HYZ29_08590 [Myxococcales bacterium]|nr:hypothetical protein [Myxococcales bacterium]